MCFGGGSDKSSREMIQMQKEEAALARQKEAERQARITSGLARIKEIFHGTPEMENVTKKYNWGTYNPAGEPNAASGNITGQAVSGLPAGFKYVRAPATTTAASAAPRQQQSYVGGRDAVQPSSASSNIYGSHGSGGGYASGGGVSTGGAGTGGGGWVIQGPDGKIYKIGENLVYTGQEETGKTTGGIGDDFYNKFSQGLLDYYMPQVAEKYGEASDETKFRHARAGTLESSSKIRNIADLVKQNTIQEGLVQSNVDTATGELKDRVAKEEAAATGQLYATENPDVAASQATHALTNISAEAENPAKQALGDIFTLATIGGANFAQGMTNAKRLAAVRSGAADASRIV